MVPTDSVLSALAREVATRLLESKRRLVTAESCTGGWIAKLCTDIAGSSEWFDCGFVVLFERRQDPRPGRAGADSSRPKAP